MRPSLAWSWRQQYSRVPSRSPNWQNASRRAASSMSPYARSSSMRRSRWKLNSSSTSAFTASGRRRRYQNGRRRSSRSPMPVLHALEDRLHRARIAAPVGRLLGEPPPSGAGERVVSRAAVVLRRAPFGLDQTLTIQPVQRLVERRVLDRQLSTRSLTDQGRDPVAVTGARSEGPQHQEVQRSLNQRERRHSFPLDGEGKGRVGAFFRGGYGEVRRS